jgi:hypothetical protein
MRVLRIVEDVSDVGNLGRKIAYRIGNDIILRISPKIEGIKNMFRKNQLNGIYREIPTKSVNPLKNLFLGV